MKKFFAIATLVALSAFQAAAAEQLTPAAVEQKIVQITEMDKADKTAEIVQQFGNADFEVWRTTLGQNDKAADEKVGRVYDIRARAILRQQKPDIAKAIKDLSRAVELNSNPYWFNDLGDAYARNKDPDHALESYVKAIDGYMAEAGGGQGIGWMPLSATCNASQIFLSQCRYDEAQNLLNRWKDEDVARMGKYWGVRLLRERGHVYAALGEEELCLKSFKAALEFEAKN